MNESGTVYGFAGDLPRHVSSWFSFWSMDKPTRLTCSCNYFHSSLLSVPTLSVRLGVDLFGHAAGMLITGVCRWGMGAVPHIQFTFPNHHWGIKWKFHHFHLSLETGRSSDYPDRLITQPIYFYFIPHTRALICVEASLYHVLCWRHQTCPYGSVIQSDIQRIDSSLSENPCVLPVLCSKHHYCPQTCQLYWLSVFNR